MKLTSHSLYGHTVFEELKQARFINRHSNRNSIKERERQTGRTGISLLLPLLWLEGRCAIITFKIQKKNTIVVYTFMITTFKFSCQILFHFIAVYDNFWNDSQYSKHSGRLSMFEKKDNSHSVIFLRLHDLTITHISIERRKI